ncbi:PTS fructose transporter subunit IIB [Rathayibacter tanaceti]|uniref:PTS fructose transporter subunit IIB n=1 Tax=Rathayibacter tanaceti TaxID=1671680 RepID=UPI0009EF295E|nr:fructose PTS transporter subunit IIB [Rathayibacter tanaceti]
MRIVAVTSCIAGIAHTYMAAEALEQAAKKKGYEIQVETQGAAGSDPMSEETIAAADVVILAADLEVRGKDRFSGKPTLEVGTSEALAKAARSSTAPPPRRRPLRPRPPPPDRASSPSPAASPASPTPTWRPRPSSRQRRSGATRSTSRRRERPDPRR